MEHAAEALKIAVFLLLFVLALSISITAFGQARQTSQIILDYTDKTYDTKYIDGNGTTQRTVGVEAIVPSMYKAYKENYKIIFDTTQISATEGLYKKNSKPIFEIDLQDQVFGDDKRKEQFVMAILYGNKVSDFNSIKNYFYTNSNITLYQDGIYNKIKEKKFIEKLGVYYQEDLQGKVEEDNRWYT